MPIAKTLPFAPPGSKSAPFVAGLFERIDSITAFLRAIHGRRWAARANAATGISIAQLYGYWSGNQTPSFPAMMVLEYYAISEGFVSTSPALKRALQEDKKSRPKLSENRKNYFLDHLGTRGTVRKRVRERFEAYRE